MTRFPTYPRDILSRADALLSSKYPDGIVDPRFVEVACEAMMMEQARLTDPAFLARQIEAVGMVGKEAVDEAVAAELAKLADPNAVHLNMLRGTIAKPSVEQIVHIYGREEIAKAIRGTE